MSGYIQMSRNRSNNCGIAVSVYFRCFLPFLTFPLLDYGLVPHCISVIYAVCCNHIKHLYHYARNIVLFF